MVWFRNHTAIHNIFQNYNWTARDKGKHLKINVGLNRLFCFNYVFYIKNVLTPGNHQLILLSIDILTFESKSIVNHMINVTKMLGPEHWTCFKKISAAYVECKYKISLTTKE